MGLIIVFVLINCWNRSSGQHLYGAKNFKVHCLFMNRKSLHSILKTINYHLITFYIQFYNLKKSHLLFVFALCGKGQWHGYHGMLNLECSLQELLLSFHYVSPRDETWVISFGSKHHCLLSYLTRLIFHFLRYIFWFGITWGQLKDLVDR